MGGNFEKATSKQILDYIVQCGPIVAQLLLQKILTAGTLSLAHKGNIWGGGVWFNIYSTHDNQIITVNPLGPPVAIWHRSTRPACPGITMWRPPLAARIWRAPPHGDKNMGATHRNVPSMNIVHSYLLTLQKSILPVLSSNQNEAYIGCRMKPETLTWPDPANLASINLDTLEFGNNAYGVKRWDFYCPNVIFAMN